MDHIQEQYNKANDTLLELLKQNSYFKDVYQEQANEIKSLKKIINQLQFELQQKQIQIDQLKQITKCRERNPTKIKTTIDHQEKLQNLQQQNIQYSNKIEDLIFLHKDTEGRIKLYKSILLTMLSQNNLNLIEQQCEWNNQKNDYECPPFKLVDDILQFPKIRRNRSGQRDNINEKNIQKNILLHNDSERQQMRQTNYQNNNQENERSSRQSFQQDLRQNGLVPSPTRRGQLDQSQFQFHTTSSAFNSSANLILKYK